MLSMLFGWRKASKCKKVIKEAQCRLKLLKIKRNSIVKYLREDTAYLIKTGHEDIALSRAEQLIKDESVAVAYELIDNFFDFVRTHFKYIRRHKNCPDDIKEAVSSLIYASARCGDLPELRAMRELFEDRYGHKLAMAAVELYPGNLVNHQIKEALSTKFVSEDMKFRMVNEIATDYCLQRRLLALEYTPNWKQQEVKNCKVKADETTTLVYLDDVEEFPSSLKGDEGSKNGTIFKFKSPTASMDRRSSHESYWTEDRLSLSSSPNSSGSTNSRKRIRRRSVCFKNSEAYYDLPRKSRSTRSKRLDHLDSSDSESGSDHLETMMVAPRRAIKEIRRAESMPVERPKKRFGRDEFQRSNSCPLHVHPKLPDCDELTATFLELKKQFHSTTPRC